METKAATAPESAGAASPAATAPAAPLEKYQVVQQAVRENGKFYLKGQIVMLTAARAAQLGLDQVKPVGPPVVASTPALPAAKIAATSTVPEPTVTLQVTASEAEALHELAEKQEAAK